MNAEDAYACFRRLDEALRRLGHDQQADALMTALGAGSTGSECLGLAGQALEELRSSGIAASAAALEPLIAPCVRKVQTAWPQYRLPP